MTRFLRRLFLKNWGMKLFSFLLALVLWLALIPEEKTFSEKTLTVPLELHNIPPGMQVVEKPDSAVDVKIRAPQRLIEQITPANVHAVLDLQRARTDVQDYTLNENMISIPAGAEVKGIFPSQVRLKLEKTAEIALDVEPNIIGELQEGLVLGNIEVVPPQAIIIGPESRISKNLRLRTTPLDISGLTQPTVLDADLILPGPDFQLKSPQPTVKVRVLIQKKEEVEKTGEEKKGPGPTG